jgi:hypothetical protein
VSAHWLIRSVIPATRRGCLVLYTPFCASRQTISVVGGILNTDPYSKSIVTHVICPISHRYMADGIYHTRLSRLVRCNLHICTSSHRLYQIIRAAKRLYDSVIHPFLLSYGRSQIKLLLQNHRVQNQADSMYLTQN